MALVSFDSTCDWGCSALLELSIGFGGCLSPSFEYHRVRGSELTNGSVRGAMGLDRIARALHAPQILNLGDMAELRVTGNVLEQGILQPRGFAWSMGKSVMKIPQSVELHGTAIFRRAQFIQPTVGLLT